MGTAVVHSSVSTSYSSIVSNGRPLLPVENNEEYKRVVEVVKSYKLCGSSKGQTQNPWICRLLLFTIDILGPVSDKNTCLFSLM